MRFPGFANACAQAAAEIVTSEIEKASETGPINLKDVFKLLLLQCELCIEEYAEKLAIHEQRENKP